MAEGTETMQKTSATILGLVAVVATVVAQQGHFDVWDTLIGLTLFFIVVAYREPIDSIIEAFAFSAVLSVCCILTFGFLLEYLWISFDLVTVHGERVYDKFVNKSAPRIPKRDVAFVGLWLALTLVGARILWKHRGRWCRQPD